MKNPLSKALDYLFPRRCLCCNTLIYSDSPCCEKCGEQLAFSKSGCAKCGKQSCICKNQTLYFSAATAVFDYEGGIVNAIQELKFKERVSYAKPLGFHLHQKLTQLEFADRIDLILPAPMSKKDLNRRGYNQAVLLSKALSKAAGIPMDQTALKKIKQTEKQHNLKEEERKQNLAGAFVVKKPSVVQGKTILLCDDVYTTGSTFNELSRVLIESGAEEVFCLAVATTQRKQG